MYVFAMVTLLHQHTHTSCAPVCGLSLSELSDYWRARLVYLEAVSECYHQTLFTKEGRSYQSQTSAATDPPGVP